MREQRADASEKGIGGREKRGQKTTQWPFAACENILCYSLTMELHTGEIFFNKIYREKHDLIRSTLILELFRNFTFVTFDNYSKLSRGRWKTRDEGSAKHEVRIDGEKRERERGK